MIHLQLLNNDEIWLNASHVIEVRASNKSGATGETKIIYGDVTCAVNVKGEPAVIAALVAGQLGRSVRSPH